MQHRNKNVINNFKRKILIVEDNELNREILSVLLEKEYDLLMAEDGQRGLELLDANYRELSLVLLDVYMPVSTGFEFLEQRGKDERLSGIPVIVTTGSNKTEDEVKCLELGASDFVTKPYNPEVVLGRVHSAIKLKESIEALSAVEFDELTGFYNMPAFCHHVSETMRSAGDISFDISVSDLKAFKLINSVFGEKVGDEVLKYCADIIRTYLPHSIVGRRGDKFYALFSSTDRPSKESIEKINSLMKSNSMVPNLTVKHGICKNADKNLPVSILCDMADMAASSIKTDAVRFYAEYDGEVREHLMRDQEMEMHFENALLNEEFKVWFQPKVETKTGYIKGAEALVRWIPAEGKLISPAEFIPLFEKNGMISRLDQYVFTKVCDFQKKRRQQGKEIIPISVNLSRNSIYQSDTTQKYKALIEEISPEKNIIPLEVTESAAMEDPEINQRTAEFSKCGFSLHMDDFGTGYSSLAGLISMPFEVLKLDKTLIDHIGCDKGNTLVRHMILIAQEIGMKVVAEGVETAEQLAFLKQAGCDEIQGFYFSAPRKSEEFEELLDRSIALGNHVLN